MLVIRRRNGESFFIGDDIEVEILEVEANQVKLGIRAPRTVPIFRKEIMVIREANRASAEQVKPENLEAALKRLRLPPTEPVV